MLVKSTATLLLRVGLSKSRELQTKRETSYANVKHIKKELDNSCGPAVHNRSNMLHVFSNKRSIASLGIKI